jgi:hypothetical protein
MLPFVALVFVAATAVPAAAQQFEADPRVISPQTGVWWPPAPTPQPFNYSNAGENPGVTSVAKATYRQLATDTLNRSRLTTEINAALSRAALATAARQLAALGTPQWQFVENARSPAGDVSVYRLAYANRIAYLTVGVADNGTIYALRLAADMPSP